MSDSPGARVIDGCVPPGIGVLGSKLRSFGRQLLPVAPSC